MSVYSSITTVICLVVSLFVAIPAYADTTGQTDQSVDGELRQTRSSNNDAIPLGRSMRSASPLIEDDVKSSAQSSQNTSPGTSRPSGKQGKTERTSSSWWDTLSALVLVVGLIFLLRKVISRWSGRSPVATRSGVVEVLTRVGVAPRQQVLLLRLGGRVLLVGQSNSGMNTLAEINDPQEVASVLAAVTASKTSVTANQFARLLRRFDGAASGPGADTDQDVLLDPNVSEMRNDLSDEAVAAANDETQSSRGLLGRLRLMTSRGNA